MARKSDMLELPLEEDLVEYFLFLPKERTQEEESLNRTLKTINKFVSDATSTYLWHRDAFKLTLRSTDTMMLNNDNLGAYESLPPHLYGTLRYGENIEDEWFVVYLLTSLTKEIDGLVAKVVDTDGEFLLIEAADYLPKWANPQNCDNRVYIYDGCVHLIAPENDEEIESISTEDALNEMYDKRSATKACAEIQNSISNKIKGYPRKIDENFHRTTAYLPVGVAEILRREPSLISPAVQAFCNRDLIDAKICRAMKHFPPEVRVYSNVKFTKFLYAMLMHSKYQPDRNTGWNLPVEKHHRYKSHNIGMKIACGFEILISQAKPNSDVENDKGWHSYLKNLKDKGYFRDLLDHSKDHDLLTNKAKEYYVSHRDSMQDTPAIGQRILNLTKSHGCNLDEFKQAEGDLPPDDDDSWLDVTPDEIDGILERQYGQKKTFSLNAGSDSADFTGKITSFLNHVSDVDGAEFPASEAPVRPPRHKKHAKQKVGFASDAENSNKVNFDPSSFSCAMQNILNFAIPDDSWDSDSGMSDYDNEDGNVCAKMQRLMEEMDKELAGTTIGESFKEKENDGFEDIESFKPVDIDVNTLKNVLESYRSQFGEAGPSSNMLGPMGVQLDLSDKKNGDVN